MLPFINNISIGITLLAILLQGFVLTGCSKRDEAVVADPASDQFWETEGDAEELMSTYPDYAAAKQALGSGNLAEAERLLLKLLAEKAFNPAFANDLGIIRMRRGDNGSALEALSQAVQTNPDYERGWFNIGVLQTRMGNDASAEEAYLQAVEINPFYFEALYNLGLLYYKQGRLVESERAFLGISRNTRSSRYNRVYYQLGLIKADNGDDASAIQYYDESILLDPSHVPSYLNKAAAMLRLGMADKARDTLKRAGRLAPRDSRINWNIGLAWLDEGNDPEARKAFEKTLTLDPGYTPALVNLAAIAMRAGEDQAAKKLLEQAKEQDPDNPNIFWNLGLIAADAGDDSKAVDNFSEMVRLDPENAEARLNLAAALIRMQKTGEARAAVDEAARLNPGDFRIFWNRGLIALSEDEPEKAEHDFQKVIELKPGYAPALFNLGLARYREGDWDQARELFHRAAYANNASPYPEAHYMLGKTHSEQGNFNAAINEYEIALKLRPEYNEAAYNLALNMDQSGDHAAALKLYRNLAEGDNPPPEGLNNLATWQLENDRPEDAVPLLERAIRIRPEYPTALYNLGVARLRLENFPGAAEAFSAAVQADPDYFTAWKNLGIVHARMERFESALEAMRKAFELDPKDADTAVYVVKYLKLLNRPENEITKVYARSYQSGARNPLMLRHLAKSAFEAAAYGEAASYYEAYIKLRPSPVYIYNMGLARLRNEEFPEAVEAFKEATRLEPENFAYWKNLGIAWSRMDQYEQALQAMQRAFELNPEDADSAVYVVKYLKLLDRPENSITEFYQQAHVAGARDILILRHLARDAFQREDFDAAAGYYREYVEMRPSAAYYYNLGLALRKAGRFEEAREAYGQAVSLDPEYEKAWVNLGYIHAFLKDFRSAKAAFNRALEIDPDYENAHLALLELKNGTIQP